MKLLPSLKQKKRYILFEVQSKQQFNLKEVKDAVETALKEFLGIFGLSKASPIFLSERYKNNRFIIKVNHKYVDEVKAALILIKTIKKSKVSVHSISTSGILKKVEQS